MSAIRERATFSFLQLIFAIAASIAFGSWQQSKPAGWFAFFLIVFVDNSVEWCCKWITHWSKDRPIHD